MKQGKFQKIAAHGEVIAACVGSVNEGEVRVEAVRAKHDTERWAAIFPYVLRIVVESKEAHIRIVIRGHTIKAAFHDGQCIAAVMITGAPVTKSIQRMFRKYFGQKRQSAPRDSFTPSLPLQTRDELEPPLGGEPGSDSGTLGG